MESVAIQVQEMFESFEYDSLFWGSTFFPHHFRDKGPMFHEELCEAAHGSRYLAVAAPRGSAKSTVLAFMYPFHQICHRKVHFVLIIANTFKKASLHLEAMKTEVRENEFLRKHYSGIEIVKDAEGDSEFRFSDGYRVKVLCKGVDQIGSIRGVKFGAYRPDLIIGDDIEDDILVRNSARRRELQDVYDEALVPAGEVHKCQYIMIGTILHDDCQIGKLVSKDKYMEYNKLFYRAEEEDGTLLWPERITREFLDKIKKEKPNVYAKEYQNDPVVGLNTRFKREQFRYWKLEGRDYVLQDEEGKAIYRGSVSDCKGAIACDLAWKENRTADSSVILPGLLTPNSEILIMPYINEKGLRPDKLAEHLFYLDDKLRGMTGSSVKIGFEKAMLENVTQWLLKREMKNRGHFLVTQQLIWDGDKNTRIETRLQPRYTQGVIYHQRNMGELEHQLLRFPHGTFDDLCLEEGTKIATLFGNKNIEDIKRGDWVITPFGIKQVEEARFTGYKQVIDKFGLRATPNHKVFSYSSCFESIELIQYKEKLSKLSIKEMFIWGFQKLYSLMEGNIEEWEGRESITYLFQRKILSEKGLKDCMLLYGKSIISQPFLKVGMFTILIGIHLIMSLVIYSVYQLANTGGYLRKLIGSGLSNIWRAFDLLPQNGINLKKVGLGIESTQKKSLIMRFSTNSFARYVSQSSNPNESRLTPVLKDAGIVESISYANVYNLKVKGERVYYANGVLVSNCDSLQGLVQLLQNPKSMRKPKKELGELDIVRDILRRKKKSKKKIEVPFTESFMRL